MNKFVKFGTVIGFVLVLTGTGVSAAAFAMGASINKIGRYIEDRYVQDYDDYYSDYNNSRYEDHGAVYGTQAAEQPVITDGSEQPPTDGIEKYFEGGWHAEYPVLTQLEIKQTSGTVQILYSDDVENMTVDCDRGGIERTDYREDDRKIKLTVPVNEDEHYIIKVPSGWTLEELEVENYGGRFEGENLQALELEIHVRGGSADVTQMTGGTLDLECENGELNWTGTGESIPMIDAESDNNGTIRIEFADGDQGESYSYKLETRNGTINLPDLILEGDSDKKIPSGAARGVVDIEAKNNGTVIVTY